MMMSIYHAGPSDIRPDNKATKPRRGRKGAVQPVSPGKPAARRHEAKAAKPRRKRGFGKIKSTGAPRFTRHTKF